MGRFIARFGWWPGGDREYPTDMTKSDDPLESCKIWNGEDVTPPVTPQTPTPCVSVEGYERTENPTLAWPVWIRTNWTRAEWILAVLGVSGVVALCVTGDATVQSVVLIVLAMCAIVIPVGTQAWQDLWKLPPPPPSTRYLTDLRQQTTRRVGFVLALFFSGFLGSTVGDARWWVMWRSNSDWFFLALAVIVTWIFTSVARHLWRCLPVAHPFRANEAGKWLFYFAAVVAAVMTAAGGTDWVGGRASSAKIAYSAGASKRQAAREAEDPTLVVMRPYALCVADYPNDPAVCEPLRSAAANEWLRHKYGPIPTIP